MHAIILHDCINLHNLRMQERQQLCFFLKSNASKTDEVNTDENEMDDQSVTQSPKRRRKKDESDSSSSSCEGDLASDLKRINDEGEKKFNKDITTAVNAPLSLGLEHLMTDDVAQAQVNESATSLKAIKQLTAITSAALKMTGYLIEITCC